MADDPREKLIEERKQAYSKIRDELTKLQLSNDENYDKSILSLSSAGLGLSLTFIKGIAPAPVHSMYLLIASWIAFGAAIIVTLVSFRISQLSIKTQMEHAEKYYLELNDDYLNKKNGFHSATKWLNYISGGAFVIAVILTVTFVSINLTRGDQTVSEKKETSVPIRGVAQDGATLPRMMRIEEGATLPAMIKMDLQKGATIPAMQPVAHPPAAPAATQQSNAPKAGSSGSSAASTGKRGK
jgi:hypothetical protein